MFQYNCIFSQTVIPVAKVSLMRNYGSSIPKAFVLRQWHAEMQHIHHIQPCMSPEHMCQPCHWFEWSNHQDWWWELWLRHQIHLFCLRSDPAVLELFNLRIVERELYCRLLIGKELGFTRHLIRLRLWLVLGLELLLLGLESLHHHLMSFRPLVVVEINIKIEHWCWMLESSS